MTLLFIRTSNHFFSGKCSKFNDNYLNSNKRQKSYKRNQQRCEHSELK